MPANAVCIFIMQGCIFDNRADCDIVCTTRQQEFHLLYYPPPLDFQDRL